MDCDSSHFYSQTADWNVVSLATRYVNVVDDPSRLRTRDGRQLDPALRGYQITSAPKVLRHFTADFKPLQ